MGPRIKLENPTSWRKDAQREAKESITIKNAQFGSSQPAANQVYCNPFEDDIDTFVTVLTPRPDQGTHTGNRTQALAAAQHFVDSLQLGLTSTNCRSAHVSPLGTEAISKAHVAQESILVEHLPVDMQVDIFQLGLNSTNCRSAHVSPLGTDASEIAHGLYEPSSYYYAVQESARQQNARDGAADRKSCGAAIASDEVAETLRLLLRAA